MGYYTLIMGYISRWDIILGKYYILYIRYIIIYNTRLYPITYPNIYMYIIDYLDLLHRILHMI